MGLPDEENYPQSLAPKPLITEPTTLSLTPHQSLGQVPLIPQEIGAQECVGIMPIVTKS